MSATSALPTSPPPSSAGLPFGFTPASTAAVSPSSNYRALSFSCTPTLRFQHPAPSQKQQQQAVHSPTNKEPTQFVVSNTNTRLQRNDSWAVPFCTNISHGTSDAEPTLSLPLVPEELEDYGLRFGTFAVTSHSSGSAVLNLVNEALTKHRHLRVLSDKLTPGTVHCVTYPQGVAIRFAVRVFRLTETDQESNELQGIRGRNLIVIEEVQSNDCMCTQRPLISQLFLDEIRSGEFRVPFAFENNPQGGCLVGRPCEQNTSAAVLGFSGEGVKRGLTDPATPVRGSVQHNDDACLRLLQLASCPQYVDVQEQALCIIARQSSNDPSFARALARVDALNVLLKICAPKQSPDSAVCVMTAIANIAEAIADMDGCSVADVVVRKNIVDLVNCLEKGDVNSPAQEQVSEQARRALHALDGSATRRCV